MSDGGIRVGKRRGYTMVHNDLLPPDGSLSARAWGIYVYLVGRPDGWETSTRHLATVFREGRDAIRSALHELVAAGLMVIEEYRHGNLPVTRFAIPDEDSHGLDSQDPEKPSQVSKEQVRTDPLPPGGDRYEGYARTPLRRRLKNTPKR